MDSIIKSLEKNFGNITYLRDKRHDFLGMDITYNSYHTVSIQMEKQIEEAIEWYGEDIPPKATTPATKHVFKIDEDTELLNNR